MDTHESYICGIKGYTPLLKLPFIDIPQSIPPEPMHLLNLGIYCFDKVTS